MKTKWIMTLVLLIGLAAQAGGGVKQSHAEGPEREGVVAAQVPPGTAFTYQGQLKKDGATINGTVDLQFSLWDAATAGGQIGSTQTLPGVSVTNGLFTVQLDFGPGAFIGAARWLGIAVRSPAGTGGFAPLMPRQPLTPTPYALALPGMRTEQTEPAPNVIGGWPGNTVDPSENGGTISGGGLRGGENRISGSFGAIGGGVSNTAADFAAVGGGQFNTAEGSVSAVPGGFANVARGSHSFAAGTLAKADHDGAFVWADEHFEYFPSSGPDSFNVRAAGGTRFVSAIDNIGNPTAGVQLAPGGGSWSSLSDRASKENGAAVDPRDILARLAAVPVESWSYASQDPTIRHIGPTAQDFYAAFGVGEDDKHITTIDEDGIALAAIQGLNQEMQEKDTRISQLEARNADLEQRVAALEKLVATLSQQQAAVQQ